MWAIHRTDSTLAQIPEKADKFLTLEPPIHALSILLSQKRSGTPQELHIEHFLTMWREGFPSVPNSAANCIYSFNKNNVHSILWETLEYSHTYTERFNTHIIPILKKLSTYKNTQEEIMLENPLSSEADDYFGLSKSKTTDKWEERRGWELQEQRYRSEKCRAWLGKSFKDSV